MATKIPFNTIYEHTEGKGNETGNEFDLTRHFRIDEEGRKVLVVDGKTNRQEKINSYLDSVLIENVLAKATLDPTILNRCAGLEGDFTVMPKTLMEAQNMVLRIKDEFNQLPVETRIQFNNSVDKYIAEYGNENWMKITGYIKPEEIKTEEPKQEETKE